MSQTGQGVARGALLGLRLLLPREGSSMMKSAASLALLAALLFVGASAANAQFRSQQGQTQQFGARQPSSGNPSGLPGADYRGTAQSPRGAPSNFRGTAQSPRGQQTNTRTQQTQQPTQQTQPQGQAGLSPTLQRMRRGERKQQETKRIDPRDVYRLGNPATRDGGGEGGGGGY